ncbi:hypothetical protein B0T10DRAFT_300544 [Thelonectria olida]|uniref:Uncharacterized protein n=1 Tax=Thelonectria olida TaxID=1576542 RepID=A0A9P8W8F7_9HYPO|nr:hypothetical protein B0T10DRAFT_300544 [Thelonectria olida]
MGAVQLLLLGWAVRSSEQQQHGIQRRQRAPADWQVNVWAELGLTRIVSQGTLTVLGAAFWRPLSKRGAGNQKDNERIVDMEIVSAGQRRQQSPQSFASSGYNDAPPHLPFSPAGASALSQAASATTYEWRQAGSQVHRYLPEDERHSSERLFEEGTLTESKSLPSCVVLKDASTPHIHLCHKPVLVIDRTDVHRSCPRVIYTRCGRRSRLLKTSSIPTELGTDPRGAAHQIPTRPLLSGFPSENLSPQQARQDIPSPCLAIQQRSPLRRNAICPPTSWRVEVKSTVISSWIGSFPRHRFLQPNIKSAAIGRPYGHRVTISHCQCSRLRYFLPPAVACGGFEPSIELCSLCYC